jgi:hypothetical protein
MSRHTKRPSPRRKHGPPVIGHLSRQRLRSEEPEEIEPRLTLSRACTPCKSRGLIIKAHRVMPDGRGLCDACYRAESRQ